MSVNVPVIDPRSYPKYPKLQHPIDLSSLFLPGIKLYDWQVDALRGACEPMSRALLSGANETGKTSTVATLFLLSAMVAFPGARCFAISKSERQVEEQLFIDNIMPIVSQWPATWKVTAGELKVKHANGSSLRCYVCKDAQNVEGFHSAWRMHRGVMRWLPCIYLMDECKGISNDIFEAVNRINPYMLLAMSSPGRENNWWDKGMDWDNLKKFVPRKTNVEYELGYPAAYDPPALNYDSKAIWTYRLKVSRDMCPHLLGEKYEERRQALEKEYGKNSAFIQSMVYGEPQRGEEGDCIFLERHIDAMKAAMRGDFIPRGGDTRAAGDISGGTGKDLSVLGFRQGTHVPEIMVTPAKSSILQADEWCDILKHVGIQPSQFIIDGGGLGQPVGDYMEQKCGFAGIQRAYQSNNPMCDIEYTNHYTEIHFWIRELLELEILKVKYCPQLLVEMRRRLFIERDDNRIRAEPKEKYRERHRESPNFLDTLIYLFWDFDMDSIRRGLAARAAVEKPKNKPQFDNTVYLNREVEAQTRGVYAGLPRLPGIGNQMRRA